MVVEFQFAATESPYQTHPMPLPILSTAQMRQWESAAWASGISERAVIAEVGRLAAARATALTQAGDRLLLLAGKGHNGDDVRAMVPRLPDREVELLNVTDPDTALTDLRTALGRRPALVVDGLFGIGLNRPLSSAWRGLIASLNASRLRVLAVDVPSGLDADTGATHGAAVEASWTLVVGTAKTGQVTVGASQYVGRLEVLPEVGLGPCPVLSELQWTMAEDFAGFPPARPAGGHKGTFGQLVILAGSRGYHGAAVLAARAAQRAQPGLITLRTTPDVYVPVAAQLQAVMVEASEPTEGLPKSTSALLVGPGLAAPSARAHWESRLDDAWQRVPVPVVVDASALDWLREGPVASTLPRVLTPHPGEAARLLRTGVADVQRDRQAALRELSRRFGNCWVVLKGQHTLVGRSEGPCFVNSSGNSHLAQGGSGDVLAGYLAGWLAQPLLSVDPMTVLRWAVWRHGVAADQLQTRRPGWVVEELVDSLAGDRDQGRRDDY